MKRRRSKRELKPRSSSTVRKREAGATKKPELVLMAKLEVDRDLPYPPELIVSA